MCIGVEVGCFTSLCRQRLHIANSECTVILISASHDIEITRFHRLTEIRAP